MNISAPFISRPVATILLTIGVTLAGFWRSSCCRWRRCTGGHTHHIGFGLAAGRGPGDCRDKRRGSIGAPPRANRQCDGDDVDQQHGPGAHRLAVRSDRDINGAARDVQAAINDASADLPTNLPAIQPIARSIQPTRRS